MNKKLLCVLSTALLLFTTALSAEISVEMASKLAQKLPSVEASQISATPSAGIYSVDLNDKIAYVTQDGNYLFTGDMIDLQKGLNLTQLDMGKKRVGKLAAIPNENFIIFPAKNKKHTITVFTDIDCAWCRRLHAEISDFSERGIEVRYLLRPRSGPQSNSWQKADAVFCSKNPQKNLTRAKQGQEIKMKKCGKTPTMDNVILAESLGFMGTPVVLGEQGQYLGGYVAPEELLAKLEAAKAK